MRVRDKVVKGLVYLSVIFTMAMLFLVVGQVLMRGIPYLKPELFAWEYTTDNVSMMPAIINTIEMIVITLAISVPLGVAGAIYMVEYAKPGNKIVKAIRTVTETLQGIPSIVFGLFGMLFFCYTLGWGMSMISGCLTMAIMTLPLMIRSTEEALLATPNSLREASYGLGARKVRTIFRVVLPAASTGIFAGIILSIGRIVGETAAIIYTAGDMPQVASPTMSGRTLAIHMYTLQTESLHKDQAYATAVVLLIVVVLINFLSTRVQKKLEKENGNG